MVYFQKLQPWNRFIISFLLGFFSLWLLVTCANQFFSSSVQELYRLQVKVEHGFLLSLPLCFLSLFKDLELWIQIILGLILGTILGGIPYFKDFIPNLEVFKVFFLDMVRMLVPLLIFASMTMGITSIKDQRKLGRLGLKTLLLYLLTTLMAIGMGFLMAFLLHPGEGIQLGSYETLFSNSVKADLSPMGLLQIIVPENLFSAFFQSNYVQIIFFALFFGWSINRCEDRGRPLLKSVRSLVEVLYKMLEVVMKVAPYGVFAMMASTISTHGFKVLLGLFLYLFTIYLGCFLHLLLVSALCLLHLYSGLNPLRFFKGMKDAIVVAFSTSSSNATLATSLHCVEKKLGVSRNIAHFVLPLGATVNMDGAALSLTVTVMFVAQATGISLNAGQYIAAILTAVLSAIGAAGIPGSGGAMMEVVVGAAGLPTGAIAALWGVNNIREMASTPTNILGDAAVAVVVAKSEGELDLDQYNEKLFKSFEENNV